MTNTLCDSRFVKYSELITLGVITCTFEIALNAKCYNAKCNKLIVLSQKYVHVAIPSLGSERWKWRVIYNSADQTTPTHRPCTAYCSTSVDYHDSTQFPLIWCAYRQFSYNG